MRSVTGALVIPLLFVAACSTEPRIEYRPLESTYTGPISDYDDGVLLVITWADWASTWPLLREELGEYEVRANDRIDFRYVNVDEQPDLARSLGADIVPSIVIVRNGQVVDILPNITTAEDLLELEVRWLVA